MLDESFGGQHQADCQARSAPKRQRVAKPKGSKPAVETFGAGATGAMVTNTAVPSSPIPSGGQKRSDSREESAASGTGATQPSSRTIALLIDAQRKRRFCIKSQSRCDRSCESFIASYLGYAAPKEKDAERAGEKERKALFARAAAVRKAIEKGGHDECDDQETRAPSADGEGVDSVFSACGLIVMKNAIGREAWDDLRKAMEKQMRALAKSLPVYAWASTVAGFGELGLAIIIGETGDLNNYATKERVWKRLGLAVIEGERQQKRTNVDQAAAHGYNPRRRAEIWTIADSMFKHQWRGAKEDRVACPAGPYGEVYARRKAHTETREGWSAGRRDNDARRVMTKALIEDVWRVWQGLPPLAASDNGDGK